MILLYIRICFAYYVIIVSVMILNSVLVLHLDLSLGLSVRLGGLYFGLMTLRISD